MLRELVLYMVSRFPRGVGRTRLMKLLFLVDAIALKELGRSVTGIDWRRWRYGPFSKDVLDVLDELVDDELLAVDPGPEVRYVALTEPPKIPEEVKKIVDKIVDEYGFLPLEKLLEKVYSEFHIDKLGMGEKIVLDWRREILELAEKSGDDEAALVELLGRLYDTYRDALDALPRDILTIYAIAATHLAKHNPEKLKTLTSLLLEVLEDIRALLKNDARATIPPELRRKVLKIYRELIDIATEAVKR